MACKGPLTACSQKGDMPWVQILGARCLVLLVYASNERSGSETPMPVIAPGRLCGLAGSFYGCRQVVSRLIWDQILERSNLSIRTEHVNRCCVHINQTK